MLAFAWPWMFLVLPLPWLVYRMLPPRRPAQALRLPHRALHLPATGDMRGWVRNGRNVAWLAAWCALVVAAARPQWVGPPRALERSGRGVMLAVDMSASMQTRDMNLGGRAVSRFAAVRAIAGDFIDRRKGDEVGLILFGTHAYLVTPLTYDLDAVRAQLRNVAVGLAGPNTAIGDAIGVAVRRLRTLPSSERVLVLLTDGVNNAGTLSPMEAARIARAAGVHVYTIGIGSDRSNLPGPFNQIFGNPDASIDVNALKRIARLTGGHFYRATDTRKLAEAYRAIDAQEPTLQGDIMRRPRMPLYPWPLAVSMLLALLAMWRPIGSRLQVAS